MRRKVTKPKKKSLQQETLEKILYSVQRSQIVGMSLLEMNKILHQILNEIREERIKPL